MKTTTRQLTLCAMLTALALALSRRLARHLK